MNSYSDRQRPTTIQAPRSNQVGHFGRELFGTKRRFSSYLRRVARSNGRMRVWIQSVPEDGNLDTKWSSAPSNSPLVDYAGVFHRRRDVRILLFSGAAQRRALLPIYFAAPLAYRRWHGCAFIRAMAILRKASCSGDQPTSMDWTFLSAVGRNRVDCRFCHVVGFEGGHTDSLGLRHPSGAVVLHWPTRLPHGSAKRHSCTPALDDSELRTYSCRGHSAKLPAIDAVRFALVISYNLRRCFMVVLGSKSIGRGVDGAAQPSRSSDDYTRPGRLRIGVCKSPYHSQSPKPAPPSGWLTIPISRCTKSLEISGHFTGRAGGQMTNVW
jgi:hypothetical protein